MPAGEISSRSAVMSSPNSLTCGTSRSSQMEAILLWQGMMLSWSMLVSRLSRSMKDWQELRVNCQLALPELRQQPSRTCQDWANVADFYGKNVEIIQVHYKYTSSVLLVTCSQFEILLLVLSIQAIGSFSLLLMPQSQCRLWVPISFGEFLLAWP